MIIFIFTSPSEEEWRKIKDEFVASIQFDGHSKILSSSIVFVLYVVSYIFLPFGGMGYLNVSCMNSMEFSIYRVCNHCF